jgi:hypothetical protein
MGTAPSCRHPFPVRLRDVFSNLVRHAGRAFMILVILPQFSNTAHEPIATPANTQKATRLTNLSPGKVRNWLSGNYYSSV